ncbi:MAG TPA: IS21-like element helper ATPase IstB [Steroidobacteraceae bacterium]|jgi:DNA replication protein DnaC|nr:IS21-like element helper ATPase IstB [Steroidobacteraceae bacterium]
MLLNDTLQQLHELRLAGMAAALEEQLTNSACAALGFEERFALLVDRETNHRHDRRLTALLKRARLKYPQACIEDAQAGTARGLNRTAFTQFALSRWVEQGLTVVIIGPTGSGKSWLACALAQQACRREHSALYLRVPRLAEELRILHGKGGFATWLAALARTEVLVLDDWALAPLEPAARADLLEVIDDRAGTRSRATILTTQLPVDHWHAWLGDPTIADAILDRLLSNEHRIQLKGESLRRATREDTTKTGGNPTHQ